VVASGGNDIVNTLKSANEFGLQKAGISFVAPATFLTDVKSMGLDIAQGLTYITGFTWTYDDTSRAFAQKFFERHKAMPTMGQAGVYSATRHYLHAVAAATWSMRPRSPRRCASCRSAMPSSATAGSGKTAGWCMTCIWSRSAVPATSDQWDLEKVQDVMAGNDVFRPLSESDCPLVKK
jgi:branched-chain amino acid transport system substrate-binding protein